MTPPSKRLLRLFARKWLKESDLGREVAAALPPGSDPVAALLEIIEAGLVVVEYEGDPSNGINFGIVPAGKGWFQ